MKKRKLYFTSLIVLFLWLIPAYKASAADQMYRVEWADDVVLYGQEQHVKNFYVPQNTEVKDAELNLDYEISPTLIKEISSISILVNGREVHSQILSNENKVKLTIDKKLLKKGTNSLAIRTFLKSTKEDCEKNNEINWLVLKNQSNLKVPLKRAQSKAVNDIFENTYQLNETKATVSIVGPEKMSVFNYQQLTNVAAQVGYQNRGKEIKPDIKLYTYDELEEVKNEAIVIGSSEQLQKKFPEAIKSDDLDDYNENGSILLRTVDNNQYFFLVTDTNEQLKLLNQTLSDSQLMKQLDREEYFLKQDNILNDPIDFDSVTLADLGYETNTQQGDTTYTFDYFLSLPGNKKIGKNNQLTFKYSYPAALVEEDANVLVTINGQEQLTKKISKEKDADELTFTIPEQFTDYSRLNLTLTFNLNPKIAKCLWRQDYKGWVKMDAEESQLLLDIKNRADYSLATSHGLAEDEHGILNEELHIDSFKHIEMASIIKLAQYFGEMSQGVKKFSVVESSEDEAARSAKMIVGLNQSHLVKDLNEHLQLPISKDNYFKHDDLFIQSHSALAAIQLTNNHEQLVISSNDKKQLNTAIEQYVSMQSLDQAVVIQHNDMIYAQKNREEVAHQLKHTVFTKELIYSFIILLIGLFILGFIYKKL